MLTLVFKRNQADFTTFGGVITSSSTLLLSRAYPYAGDNFVR